jgi:hypothetical protein
VAGGETLSEVVEICAGDVVDECAEVLVGGVGGGFAY